MSPPGVRISLSPPLIPTNPYLISLQSKLKKIKNSLVTQNVTQCVSHLIKRKNVYYYNRRWCNRLIRFSLQTSDGFFAILQAENVDRILMEKKWSDFNITVGYSPKKGETAEEALKKIGDMKGVTSFKLIDEDEQQTSQDDFNSDSNFSKSIEDKLKQQMEELDKKLEQSKKSFGISIEDAYRQWMKQKSKKISNDSLKHYESALNYLNFYFLDITKDLSELNNNVWHQVETTFEGKQKLNTNKDEAISNTTINNFFSAYKLFQEYCKKRYPAFVPYPLENLPTEPKISEHFSDDDLKNIFNSDIFDDTDKDFIKCSLYTGLRIAELQNLEAKNFEDDIGCIKVIGTKTDNAARRIILHSEILPIIKKRTSKGKYIWPEFIGKDLSSHHFRRKLMKLGFTRELGNKTFHSFRKNFAVQLNHVSTGNVADRNEILAMFGHSTDKTSRTFDVHYSGGNLSKDVEHFREVIEKIRFSY
jgi:integrase